MKKLDYGKQRNKAPRPIAIVAALILLAGVIYLSIGLLIVLGQRGVFVKAKYPSSDHAAIDRLKLYESDHNFNIDPQRIVKTTGFGGEALGHLILRGDSLTRMEENGTPALICEGDVRFCYEDIRDYANPQIDKFEWKMIDDTAKDIGSYQWGERIGKGGLLVQKSNDGQTWETMFTQTNFLADSLSRIDGFFSIPQADLDIGCYYKIVLAYKMERCTGNGIIPFTFSYQDLWNVEEYTLYLVGDDSYYGASEKEGFFTQVLAAPARALRRTGGGKPKGDAPAVVSLYGPTVNHTLRAAFDDAGRYCHYVGEDSPASLEVPSDQYMAARLLMKKRIDRGQVPGVRDPEQADTLVCKGSVSYIQAKNMAQSGKIDALSYDAPSGFVSSTSQLGVSSSIAYAMSIWSNDTAEVALQKSLYNGIDVGNVLFVVDCIQDQAVSNMIQNAATNAMKPASEALTKALGPKACAVIINATRNGAKPIYGAAAMKSLGKLFRTGAIPVVATVIDFGMQTLPDFARTFRGEMSKTQLFKNLAGTTGGLVGAKLGASAGTMLVPGVGTVVGAAIGGLIGSFGVDAIADLFAKDDSEIMMNIITVVFLNTSNDYLLNEQEAKYVSEAFLENADEEKLRKMYASNNYMKFAEDLIMPFVNDVVANRSAVIIPTDEAQIQACMISILEDIHDEAA